MATTEHVAPRSRRASGRGDELRETRALYETTQEICSRLDLDHVLQAIVRRTNELLGGDVSYLATADDSHQVLRMRAFDNIHSERFQQLVLPYGVGLGGTIAVLRRPLTTSDYLKDRDLEHADYIDEIVREEGLYGAAGVPVEFEQRLLAVLFVAFRHKARLSQHQVTLLSSLANSAAIAMNNAQTHERLGRAIGIHERLMELALADHGPQRIADTLATLIGGPVVLLDWAAHALAEASFDGERPVVSDRVALEAATQSGPLGPSGPSAGFELDGMHGQVIRLGGLTEGYLLVRPANDDSGLGQVAVEQAATVFALELAKMRSAEQAEAQLRGSLLGELFSEPLTGEAALVRQAHRFGVDLYAPHVVAVVKQLQVQPAERQLNVWRRIAYVASSVCHRITGSMVVTQDESLVLLLAADSPEDAQAVGRRIFDECRHAGLPPIAIGLSNVCHEPAGYAQSFREASRTADAARRLPRLTPVMSFSSLEYHQLVLGTRPSADLVQLAGRQLAPLIDHDAKQRGGSLVETLQVYLECCGNLEATARRLAVHPNTLRGRMARIGELLDRDLQDASTRLDLQLAVATLDLGGP